MGIADSFFGKYDRQIEGGVPLHNPLVTLRHRDDQGIQTDATRRTQLIADLEGLSRRLWHMTTVITPEMLLHALLDEPDGGERDLALLDAYADLVGLTAVSASSESPEVQVADIVSAVNDLL